VLKRVGAYAMGRGVALAVSVYETGLVIVQRAAVHRGDRLFRDRLAGSGQPLFPFGRSMDRPSGRELFSRRIFQYSAKAGS
jgi:hypothetical protein